MFPELVSSEACVVLFYYFVEFGGVVGEAQVGHEDSWFAWDVCTQVPGIAAWVEGLAGAEVDGFYPIVRRRYRVLPGWRLLSAGL